MEYYCPLYTSCKTMLGALPTLFEDCAPYVTGLILPKSWCTTVIATLTNVIFTVMQYFLACFSRGTVSGKTLLDGVVYLDVGSYFAC